jgi:PAS domain S-box-containing protein
MNSKNSDINIYSDEISTFENIPGMDFDSSISIFKRSIEQSPISIVITDRLGNILYVNEKFTNITGYLKQEAIGKNPKILKSGKQNEKFYIDMWETISSGNTWRGEFINKRKDGSLYSEHASISPVYGKNNEIITYIAMKEDITELKNLINQKEELLLKNEILITNLNKARYDEELANKSKSRFIANMSHALRTPLNGIIGFSSFLLHEDKLSNSYKEMIKLINQSGKKLLELLNDILEISEIESGKMSISKYSFNIFNVMYDLSSIYNPIAEEKGIFLRYHKIGDLPELIFSDGVKVRQILMHLISNAIKYTNSGSVDIYLRTDVLGDKKMLYGTVKDTGIGIHSSKFNQIFNYFEQIDMDNEKKPRAGTGIGLSIVKAYVNLLGGNIAVKSKEGEGSEFYFNIEIEF